MFGFVLVFLFSTQNQVPRIVKRLGRTIYQTKDLEKSILSVEKNVLKIFAF